MTDLIDRVWAIVVGHEGDTLDLTRTDKGNWTGGEVGVGELRGSKFGISAKRYPQLDIAGLTYDAAKALFVHDYWQRFGCDTMPAPIGLLVVDAGYNGGDPIRWLQSAINTNPDGHFGPVSQAALATAARNGAAPVLAEFMAHRLAYLTSLPTWPTFGARDGEPMGWARRLSLLPYQAMALI